MIDGGIVTGCRVHNIEDDVAVKVLKRQESTRRARGSGTNKHIEVEQIINVESVHLSGFMNIFFNLDIAGSCCCNIVTD